MGDVPSTGQPAQAFPGAPAHGGDLSALKAAPDAYAGAWMDLSTGINPFSWPHPAALPPVTADAWSRLPSRAALGAVLEAARAAYGLPQAAGIAAVPGTQAAIQWLPRLFATARVTVLGPTYTEHAHVWRQCGHTVTEIDGVPGTLNGIDVLIVVNPNNPDGRAIGAQMLKRWHGEMKAKGGWLIVDEAFADVIPENSLASAADAGNLLVLRSFGKVYGLAGIRLGFVLGDREVLAVLDNATGPWAISGPALEIGAAALADTAWLATMREELRARARRFDTEMRTRGIHVLGGTPLFRLAKLQDAAGFAAALRSQGIHVRIFDYNPHWVRFGLPADEGEFWRRLDLVLKDFALA
jgi:cobalamin biosynthetic protein CobC